MAPRGNNMIPNGHFHKGWQKLVRCWFDQPFRKMRRYKKRVLKARQIAPRPVKGPLRAIVNCPSFRYNSKTRLGRGFSLNEIRKAGLCPEYARSVGIAVDHRRWNKSTETMQKNIQRLKEYKQRLILFPMKKVKVKEFDQKIAHQVNLNNVFGLKQAPKRCQVQKITAKIKRLNAFQYLRSARLEAKVISAKNKKNRVVKDEFESKM